MMFPLQSFCQEKTGMKTWDQGKLDWSDFQIEEAASSQKSQLSIGVDVKKYWDRRGNNFYRYSQLAPFVDRNKSWVLGSSMTETELQFNQILFDLAENISRNMGYEEDNLDESRFFELYNKSDSLFRVESAGGQNIEVIQEYQSKYSNIGKRHFTENCKSFPFGMMLGLGVPLPIISGDSPSSYMDKRNLFREEVGFYKKNWAFSLSVELFLNEIKKDFQYLDYKPWISGDEASELHFRFSLGYTIYKNDWFRLSPTIGTSLNRLYSDGQRLENEDSFVMPGYSIQIGTHMDFIPARLYSFSALLSSQDCYELCFRVNPYLSWNYYPTFGRYLAFNISLSICLFASTFATY